MEVLQAYCSAVLHSPGFPRGSVVKSLPASAGGVRDMGSAPGSGRSDGEGDGNPLQYFSLVKSMDRSLVGYNPWGRKELDTTSRLKQQLYSLLCQLGISANFVGLTDVLWGWVELIPM